MAWYSDEQYVMIQDSREKKSIAASAHKQRTHCGKCGSVKFPSDYLSRKELKAMNGECVKYASLKEPMTWDEFKELPDDLKVEYIKSLRERFNVPDKEIADMFGVLQNTIYRWFKTLGLCKGMGSGNKGTTWNKEGWLVWLNGANPDAVEASEDPIEEENVDIHEDDGGENVSVEPLEDVGAENCYEDMHECAKTESSVYSHEKLHAVPNSGTMTFNCPADQALSTIAQLLGNADVFIKIEWEAHDI